MQSELVSDDAALFLSADKSSDLQISGEAAETFIAEKRLGERIKQLRLKKGMGLVEVGRHTGLSASFLSQLETGRVVPTLRNLARIALVFSKDLSYFFEPEPKTLFRVQRGKDRVRLPQSGTDDPAYFFESLGYMVPDRELDPYFAEFLPNVVSRRFHQHQGCEFLYVVEGNMEIVHGESTYRLTAGDAAYFDANTQHGYSNSGQVPAKALIVTIQSNSNNNSNGAASNNTSTQSTPLRRHRTPGMPSEMMRARTEMRRERPGL